MTNVAVRPRIDIAARYQLRRTVRRRTICCLRIRNLCGRAVNIINCDDCYHGATRLIDASNGDKISARRQVNSVARRVVARRPLVGIFVRLSRRNDERLSVGIIAGRIGDKYGINRRLICTRYIIAARIAYGDNHGANTAIARIRDGDVVVADFQIGTHGRLIIA